MTTTDRMAYRPAEAAQVLGVGRDVIYDAMNAGELRSFKAGRARLIPADSIREYIARKLEESNK